MRIENYNPNAGDQEIYAEAMNRLEKVAQDIAEKAQQYCAVGKSRPAYKSGKAWTARESGELKATIRVVRLRGDAKYNIRIYAGSKKVYWAKWVEYGTVKMKAQPFLRPAVQQIRSNGI